MCKYPFYTNPWLSQNLSSKHKILQKFGSLYNTNMVQKTSADQVLFHC